MKNSQKGFILPLLTIIVAVLAIGVGLYFYSQNKTLLTTQQPVSKDQRIVSGGNLSTYVNKDYGFQFSYPEEFVVKEVTCDTDPINCNNLQKPLLTIWHKSGSKMIEYMNISYSKNVKDAMTPYDNGVESEPILINSLSLGSYFNKTNKNNYYATTTILKNLTVYVVKGPGTNALWFEHNGVYSIGVNNESISGEVSSVILSTFTFTK